MSYYGSNLPKGWQTTCFAYHPRLQSDTAYGYLPSFAAAIVFCVLFGASMLAHIVQAIFIKATSDAKNKSGRQWWMLVFAVGALAELLGWAARVWSSQCPYVQIPFIMQISTLIIGSFSSLAWSIKSIKDTSTDFSEAPAFFTAGIYVTLGRIIQRLGRLTTR